jgi:hypothetical protein
MAGKTIVFTGTFTMTRDEQIRVRARDGEEVTLSRDAARLMGTLKDLMDLATSEDDVYPMPKIMASTLQMVCKLNDPDYTWPSSDEHSVVQLIQLIEDALYLDAPVVALKHIQGAIATRLNGTRTLESLRRRSSPRTTSSGRCSARVVTLAARRSTRRQVASQRLLQKTLRRRSSRAAPRHRPRCCSSPRSRQTPWRLLWAWWTWPHWPSSRAWLDLGGR